MNVNYQFELTIPPDTPEGRPARLTASLTQGLIRYVAILFPSGVLASIGVRLLNEGRQFLPLNGWLRDDGKLREFYPFYRMQGGPYTLVIEGQSQAADWPHIIRVTVEAAL